MEFNKYISEEIKYIQNKFPDIIIYPNKTVSVEKLYNKFLSNMGSDIFI